MSDINYKIGIVGSGYVGMSLAAVLAKKNEVAIHDIDEQKVKKINQGISTVIDSKIQSLLSNNDINIRASVNIHEICKSSEFIIIATPTDYNDHYKSFDTSTVDNTIKDILSVNNNATIIIKSTLPIGHTKKLQKKYSTQNIIFSPEFLREGNSYDDNLKPSRIIVGNEAEKSVIFANILKNSAEDKNVKTLLVSSEEAETIKLFSNAYLAMRIAFFNELDSFALMNKLSSENIINGICMDERIGNFYNNPSFGYGGYCLPKDTKQLLSSFKDTPQTLINAIITSNASRKDLIKSVVAKRYQSKTIGIYRLVMKKGSDNYRSSAVLDLIKHLKMLDLKLLIFEPIIEDDYFQDIQIVNNIVEFKERSEIILANRIDHHLDDSNHKVFSRDIFETS